MRFFEKVKDGGPDSPVTAYVLVEIKSLFSVILLHFGGTRESFHSHAFNALTLWLTGTVEELVKEDDAFRHNSWRVGDLKYTPRNLMHKISPVGNVWALSIRGPWAKTWQEFSPAKNKLQTLTHGRKVVA
jgi:hypothetical protein